mmetsp:Transcript_27765/g.84752  ORF Transcript_27765/g.84752 Transcript_27765/m.84752 type:complete len:225 (+) Transcript_27765:128-802(+)|eukprot:scaffold215227_cov31-Tisochrysis_lutea.AAC.1
MLHYTWGEGREVYVRSRAGSEAPDSPSGSRRLLESTRRKGSPQLQSSTIPCYLADCRPMTAPIPGNTDRSRAAAVAAVASARLRPPTASVRVLSHHTDTGGAGLDPQRRLVGVRHQGQLKWMEDKKHWENRERQRRDATSRMQAARHAEAQMRRRKRAAWAQHREASLHAVIQNSTRHYHEYDRERQCSVREGRQTAGSSRPGSAPQSPSKTGRVLYESIPRWT